ncbi:hypothetical protein [Paraburkholderia rhynchosiae]|uniref:Uncharacterized protein n=1 Tax=Paraburkholderia rhynchosiae TaxID=487049 RepID=A0A6J5A6P7_9BURK|nr:hypothetical protein [Paraburkholderia rhynchosiae]CAB3655956.1 hypothetical protein LMG27174_01406 [Paraburkholderia rhynchosiae]
MATTAMQDDVGDELPLEVIKHLSTQIAAAPGYVSKVFERLAAEGADAGEEYPAVRGYN